MHQPSENGSAGVDEYGNTIVTGKELAAVLGLSEPHIYTLKRRNVIQPIGPRKNQYQLGPGVRDYIAYKCGVENEANADFHRERALKEKANRELREILVKQTREQLHRAQDVSSIVADSNADIRSRISKFAHLLFLQVAGKSDPAEVKDIIDREVRKVLNELREYDSRDYYRRSKIAELDQERSQDKPQHMSAADTLEQSTGQPGWPKGKPRGSSPHPWASAANKKRWASDPEALARTLRAMNDAKLAAADVVRDKMRKAAKKRWQRIPLEQKLAHLEKMRMARRPDFAKRAVATRRRRQESPSS